MNKVFLFKNYKLFSFKKQKIFICFFFSLESTAKFLAYCFFWAVLSLISSGTIAMISFGILMIVVIALVNIPVFLFFYFAYKNNNPFKKILSKE